MSAQAALLIAGNVLVTRLAALSGAPIVPIGLWGTEVVWPRSSKLPRMTTLIDPPRISIRIGKAFEVDGIDAHADTEQIMAAIVQQLPDEARVATTPSPEDLARTYPSGRVPTAGDPEA